MDYPYGTIDVSRSHFTPEHDKKNEEIEHLNYRVSKLEAEIYELKMIIKKFNPNLVQEKKYSKNRITKIGYRKGFDIDKIILHLSNKEKKEYGGDGGSPGIISLEENEKIKTVKHYSNGWNKGKRIKFITNIKTITIEGEKGKGVEQENVTSQFNISPNKELIGLKFEKSKLVGIEEN